MTAEAPADLVEWLAIELFQWRAEIERDVGDANTAEVVLLVNRAMRTVNVQVRVTKAYRRHNTTPLAG